MIGNSKMKMKTVEVEISGTIEVPEEATNEQIEEALRFQLAIGPLGTDNPCGEPDWLDADIDIKD